MSFFFFFFLRSKSSAIVLVICSKMFSLCLCFGSLRLAETSSSKNMENSCFFLSFTLSWPYAQKKDMPMFDLAWFLCQFSEHFIGIGSGHIHPPTSLEGLLDQSEESSCTNQLSVLNVWKW